tara:strand:+ start:104 stop:340 length:237 start_codon:yes stop_codon:yes gene_type:complete
MVKPKKKLTNKEMMAMIQGLAMEIGQLKNHTFTCDMLIDDYITFKEDAEPFKEYLKEKYEPKEEDEEEIDDIEKAEDK